MQREYLHLHRHMYPDRNQELAHEVEDIRLRRLLPVFCTLVCRRLMFILYFLPCVDSFWLV